MWELDHKEGWCWRTGAFELWYWRRLLRVPWTAKRSNQSILKEINLEYSLEGLMLKLQYFGHLIWRVSSLEKTLMLGKIEGKRRRGRQRMRWLDITNSMDMNVSKLQEIVKDRETRHTAVHGVAKGRTQLSDWTTTFTLFNYHFIVKEIITFNSFYLLQTFNVLMSRINFKQRVSKYFFPLEIFGLEALNYKI